MGVLKGLLLLAEEKKDGRLQNCMCRDKKQKSGINCFSVENFCCMYMLHASDIEMCTYI